jgi:hypothetical protein
MQYSEYTFQYLQSLYSESNALSKKQDYELSKIIDTVDDKIDYNHRYSVVFHLASILYSLAFTSGLAVFVHKFVTS